MSSFVALSRARSHLSIGGCGLLLSERRAAFQRTAFRRCARSTRARDVTSPKTCPSLIGFRRVFAQLPEASRRMPRLQRWPTGSNSEPARPTDDCTRTWPPGRCPEPAAVRRATSPKLRAASRCLRHDNFAHVGATRRAESSGAGVVKTRRRQSSDRLRRRRSATIRNRGASDPDHPTVDPGRVTGS
jgi:hypothetical protein